MVTKLTDRLTVGGDWGPGARSLVVGASVVVVVAGLRAGRPILLPAALALFLAILSLPMMLWLQRRRVPAPLAILCAISVDLAIFGGIVLLASRSVVEFQRSIPDYVAYFQMRLDGWLAALQARGIPAQDYLSAEAISTQAVTGFIQDAFGRVAAFLTTTFVVVLLLVFMLAEASIFPKKFRAVLGKAAVDLERFSKVMEEVLGYLVIKTLVSLATGVSIGLWAWLMGLDFPILLGLIGFLLNYVPNIGSVLAAVPAILLALLSQETVGLAVLVATGYVGINVVFGNLIEPYLMGRRLGLSTLVVILSLVFWAWAWGPVGALLAVPLTMIGRILLENTRDLRWVAILLDKQPPGPIPVSGPAVGDRGEAV